MSEHGQSDSTPFTVFDYLGLGFILEPPAVLVHAVMSGEGLHWANAAYALPFVLLGAAFIFIGRNWKTLKERVNARFAGAVDSLSRSYIPPFIIAMIVLSGAAVLPIWIWPPSTVFTPAAIGDIIWNFEQTAQGNGYFLNMQKVLRTADGRTNQEIHVTGFGAHGKSSVNSPIPNFSGYLRSDLTNAQIPILIVAQDPDSAENSNVCVGQPLVPTAPAETFGIPPFADFDIVTFEKPFVQPGIDGITLTKFMNDFVPFTIVLEYDGTKYERQFTKVEVERQVSIFERSLTQQSNPRVMRRTNAKRAPLTPLTTLLPADPPKSLGLASPIPSTGLPKIEGK